jgi:hypothetical protein
MMKRTRRTNGYSIMSKIWQSNEIPDDFKKGVLVPVPVYKKEDNKICFNYRIHRTINVEATIVGEQINLFVKYSIQI